MIKLKMTFVLGGTALLVAACSEAPTSAMGSATFFLTEKPEEAGRCNDLEPDKTERGSDGSIWGWTTTDNGTGLLFCRKQNNIFSAWREASQNQKATHSLKFGSNDVSAVFQPI